MWKSRETPNIECLVTDSGFMFLPLIFRFSYMFALTCFPKWKHKLDSLFDNFNSSYIFMYFYKTIELQIL